MWEQTVLSYYLSGEVGMSQEKQSLNKTQVLKQLPDGSDVLASAEPQVNLQGLALVNLADINGKVLEGSRESTLGAGDGDHTRLDIDGD